LLSSSANWPSQYLFIAEDRLAQGTGERYTDGAAARARAAWRIVVDTTNKTEGQAKEMIKAWIKSGTLERREYHSETERKDFQGLWVNAANRPGNTW
jgi:hypothetical protein